MQQAQTAPVRNLLIRRSPDKVTVHGAILEFTGGDAVQLAIEGCTLGWVGAVGLHAADWRPNKVP